MAEFFCTGDASKSIKLFQKTQQQTYVCELQCLLASHKTKTCLTIVGTRDFGPAEFRQQQWLFSKFEDVSRLFGFEQFATPVLESEELFVRKAGEEITQQLYNFEASYFSLFLCPGRFPLWVWGREWNLAVILTFTFKWDEAAVFI